MKRLLKFITALFALSLAVAGCSAGFSIGPTHTNTSD
jgi:hypothetical protein